VKMKTYICRTAGLGLAGGLLAILMTPLQAETITITIGKGSGIMWEGAMFTETLSGPMKDPESNPYFGLLTISSSRIACDDKSNMREIAGYEAFPLKGVTGVGIVPRAIASATFGLYQGGTGSLSGTLGLPETAGISSTEGKITNKRHPWCIPATDSAQLKYYDEKANRTATITGTWVIVADGNQTNSEISMPPMYFGSYSRSPYGDKRVEIFPSNITLRINNLECTVSTPTTIDFGTMTRNTLPGAELASRSVPLTTTCGQPSNFINANINVQFRALTGLYEGEPSRLTLKQGGGYITGEIDNAATGSGVCTSTSGVGFDNKPIKLGRISDKQSNIKLTNQLTWRLCSGGSNLPSGDVDAAAEMLVTFN